MSLNNPKSIDAVASLDPTRAACLILRDDWPWTTENEAAHLRALVDKINFYFAYIQTKELYVLHPSAIGKKLVIEIVSDHPLSSKGHRLIEQAREAAPLVPVEIELHCKAAV